MRTATLITYNPVTEAYEMSLSTLTTTHFTSYDITCTDDLHVGRNLWVGDEFLTAEAIRNLKTTPDTLALKSLRANEITVLDKSEDEPGVLSVSNLYMTNVYGTQIMTNKADIGVVTCSQVKFGSLTLDEALLSRLIDGSGSSSSGGSSSQVNVYSDYAYITNFVSSRDFRLSGGESNSGSLQLGTRDFMYVQYDSEAQVVNTFARGVFHADNAEIESLSVQDLIVRNLDFPERPIVSEMWIRNLKSDNAEIENAEIDNLSVIGMAVGTIYPSSPTGKMNIDGIANMEKVNVSEYLTVGWSVTTPSIRLGYDSDYLTLDTEYFEDLSSSVAKNSRVISWISRSLNGSDELLPNQSLGSSTNSWHYAYLDKGLCIQGKVSTNLTAPTSWDDTNSAAAGDVAICSKVNLGSGDIQVGLSNLETPDSYACVDNLDLSIKNPWYSHGSDEYVIHTRIGGLLLAVPSGKWLSAHENSLWREGSIFEIDPDDAEKTWFGSVKNFKTSTGVTEVKADTTRKLEAGTYRNLETFLIDSDGPVSLTATLVILLQRIA